MVIEIIVGILATWRLTSLLCYEDGPFGIFNKIRQLAGRSKFFSELLACFWCTSIWVAVGVTVILLQKGWMILIPFALSAGAILFDGLVE